MAVHLPGDDEDGAIVAEINITRYFGPEMTDIMGNSIRRLDSTPLIAARVCSYSFKSVTMAI